MVVSFYSLFALYAVEFNAVFLALEQDLFPLEAVCGHPWQNGEGQLSFLIHAVSASPEVFTFAHSQRKQVPALVKKHSILSQTRYVLHWTALRFTENHELYRDMSCWNYLFPNLGHHLSQILCSIWF